MNIDMWLQRPARGEGQSAVRERAYIQSHFLGGLAAALLGFGYLILRGAMPGTMELVALLWLASPMLLAALLAASGRYELCQTLSTLNLTALVFFLALVTGGIDSLLLPWFVVIPIEAAFSARRHFVFVSVALSGAALLGLYALGAAGALPPPLVGPVPEGLTLAGLGLAVAYAGGIAVNVRQIHKSAERHARAEAANHAFLARHARDLILRLDCGGRILYASPSAQRFFGASSQAVSGHMIAEYVDEAERAFLQHWLSEQMSGKGSETTEFRFFSAAAGGERWGEISATEAGGEIIAVIRDITARKRQEEQLRNAIKQAEEASRSKSRFLAQMSHELRTPLNAIIGFSDMMSHAVLGEMARERSREYASLINRAGHHLLGLVNDILDTAKIEAGKMEIAPEAVDVRELFDDALATVQPLADEKRQKVAYSVGPGCETIWIDRRAGEQMLLNLLSNAIKFTAERGLIRAAAVSAGADCVCLSVSDNGIGIAQKDLPRLAQPFEQAGLDAYNKDSYARHHKGTGLGLSLVRALCEEHGGRMEIESREGVGTTVRLFLPKRNTLQGSAEGAGQSKAEAA